MTSGPRTMTLFIGEPSDYWPGERSDHPLDFVLVPGLGGAWTDLREGRETIRFGFPRGSRNRWFQVLNGNVQGNHNCASLAIERILHARSIKRLVVADPELRDLVTRATQQVKPDVIRFCSGRGELGADIFDA